MVQKKRPVPEVDQVFDLLTSGDSLNYAFLRGQLVVEGILVEALRAKLEHPEAIELDRLSYSGIVGMCRALGMIDDNVLGLLRKIGKLRNTMAHDLRYELSFQEIFELAKLASAAGVSFSDETIFNDEQRSREWYGASGILQELFQNLAQDLVCLFDPKLEGVFSEFFSPPAGNSTEHLVE
ncbi:hypothetical protein ABLO27_07015 [Roseibium sp. SCPC15]|uniref:hypothetical protein n=1 Tax=Roseibium sp. SCP15 TaxID=3141376 RepID=UPI00333BE0C2